MSETEISYGRVQRDGVLCGYATYVYDGHKNEIINVPYGRFIRLVDGVEVKPNDLTVMIWTKVAGWLGMRDLSAQLGRKRVVN